MKRIFDIVMATFGLALVSPLFVWIAWKIKIEDGGPIFYRGVRVGFRGKLFRIFKFRSMVVNADKIGPLSTKSEDPRITQIGRWIREHKVDELPQLLNVLAGDMSFVGPRPEVKSEVDTYGPELDIIFKVRPGITDFSSIEFRNEGDIISQSGITDAHEAYRKLIKPRKIELQKKYAINHSFILDIKLILQTLLLVVGKK
ncbi:MAG: sugar transferase [Desulfobacterales bacterium]|nr:sugar transferase [Desulfobacterales bacterium]